MIIALLLAIGPWDITVPVDGLKDANAAKFVELVTAHFRTLKSDDGRALELNIATKGDIATITLECPVETVEVADLSKALEGSDFKIRTESWRIRRSVAFRWSSDAPHVAERVKEIEETLSRIGRSCTGARVTALESKGRAEYRLDLTFEKDGDAPANKIVAVLKQLGCDARIVFVKGDRGGAVVTRAPNVK